jgi:hypothetical protein
MVAQTGLYDTLGVPPTASRRQIVQAYNNKVQQLDTTANKEVALQLYQKYGAAYQVLTDEQARAKYDEFGTADFNNEQMSDVVNLITQLLGIKKFEEYVGQASLLGGAGLMAFKSGGTITEDDKKRLSVLSKERQAKVAQVLKSKLQHYVTGDKDGFIQAVRQEADEVSAMPFGTPLLHLVGYMYERAAQPYLGNVVGEWFKRQAHSLSTGVCILQAHTSGSLYARACCLVPAKASALHHLPAPCGW